MARSVEKYREMSSDELRAAGDRAGGADFPPALSNRHRPSGRFEETSGSEERFRARENIVARSRIEEGVMANETMAPDTAKSGQIVRERGIRQELVGVVTSAKMQKTIVVKVTRTTQHPLYQRVVRSGKKYYAHDETGEARVGDIVRIVATRPLSRLKRWRLKEVIQRSTRAA